MRDVDHNLFVYGTLRRGSSNDFAKLLRRSAEWIGHGRARGRLYLISAYHGFVPSEIEGDWVYGDVYRLQTPELMFLELDRYEGCSATCAQPHEYRRSPSKVLLETGMWIEASIYLYAADISGKQRILSGDFLKEQAGLV